MSAIELDLKRAEEVIDDETGVVLITEPHNPSGVFSSRESVKELVIADDVSYLFQNVVA